MVKQSSLVYVAPHYPVDESGKVATGPLDDHAAVRAGLAALATVSTELGGSLNSVSKIVSSSFTVHSSDNVDDDFVSK